MLMHTNILNNLARQVFNKNIDHFERIYGGMSNYNYFVVIEDNEYIFRIPLESSNIIVNRKNEKENLLKLKDKKYVLKTIYFDEDTGYKISEYVAGLSLNNIEDAKLPYNLVTTLLKDLHSTKLFNNYNNSFDELLTLENLAKNNNVDYFNIKNELMKSPIALLNKKEYTSCHCDCLPDNFILDDDNNLYLLDWEFSENNDPIYDIACFGENDFQQALTLFKVYYPNYTFNELERLYYWRIYQNLKWFNLALFKHLNGLSTEFKFDFEQISQYFIDSSLEMLKIINTLYSNEVDTCK